MFLNFNSDVKILALQKLRLRASVEAQIKKTTLAHLVKDLLQPSWQHDSIWQPLWGAARSLLRNMEPRPSLANPSKIPRSQIRYIYLAAYLTWSWNALDIFGSICDKVTPTLFLNNLEMTHNLQGISSKLFARSSTTWRRNERCEWAGFCSYVTCVRTRIFFKGGGHLYWRVRNCDTTMPWVHFSKSYSIFWKDLELKCFLVNAS